MSKIIITDLTRFEAADIVCTAGTDMESGACIRPMPYLKTAFCKKLGILPGAILSGDFKVKRGATGPHREDASYTAQSLRFDGPSSSADFKAALKVGAQKSVESGFEIALKNGQKHIPVGHAVERSIITLAVDPSSVEILEDQYKPGKTKIHFADSTGRRFAYFPITDLGFHHYADAHRASKGLARINAFIKSQPETLLRLGLSRAWQNPQGINGYWMQVNGVYTFPDFYKDIRSYK
jgi:hypothetical protein